MNGFVPQPKEAAEIAFTRRQRFILLLRSDRQNLIVTILAVGLSVGWIIGAVWDNAPLTAGRGGAVGIALSFYLLFVGGNLGADVSEVLQYRDRSPEAKVQALVSRINTDSAVTRHQNIYLAVSSITGTLCWGFGDLATPYVPSFLVKDFGEVVTFLLRFYGF